MTLDYFDIAAVGTAGFFVVLSVIFLARYRTVSARISADNDTAKDLVDSLEARLKTQDERIVDIMTRMEVLQSRALQESQGHRRPLYPQPTEEARYFTPMEVREQRTQPQAQAQAPAPQVKAKKPPIDRVILGMLTDHARTSVEIKEMAGLSREHAARLMKSLFEKGWVTRNDEHKPFVYELTEAGRNYLSTG